MIGVDCLAFVTPAGQLVGAPHVGVTKVTKAGRGHFLLDHVARPGARVKISALPQSFAHDWRNTEHGLLVRVFDRSGAPTDHGFAICIESPATPETLPAAAPVPEFSTAVRGELGQGEEPPPATATQEPILASTMGEDAPSTATEEMGEKEPTASGDAAAADDEAPVTTSTRGVTVTQRRKGR